MPVIQDEVKLLKRSDIVTGIDGEEWVNIKRKKTKTPVRVRFD